jgi:NAD(P)-dependent dehydrogenase (short-subunit alcohol dehydrogenase family)
MMIAQGTGLIVNISFFAAQKDDAGVAYGVAKAATDRMAAIMAHELREHNIAVVSLYPGLVRTESVMKSAEYFDLSNSESPEFIGLAIAALANDPDLMQISGQVHIAASLALEYGYTDIDGRQPKPLRLEDV